MAKIIGLTPGSVLEEDSSVQSAVLGADTTLSPTSRLSGVSGFSMLTRLSRLSGSSRASRLTRVSGLSRLSLLKLGNP